MLLSIGSLTIISVLIYQKSKKALTSEVFNHLESVAENKAEEVSEHFLNLNKSAFLISNTSLLKTAFRSFDKEFHEISQFNWSADSLSRSRKKISQNYLELFSEKYDDTLSSKEQLYTLLPKNKEAIIFQSLLNENTSDFSRISKGYDKAFSEFDPQLSNFIDHLPFNKISFVNFDGYVIYCNGSQKELGANVLDSAFRKSGISRLFKQLQLSKVDTTYVCDYSPYLFNLNAPTPFLLKPVFDRGQFIGVLLFEISTYEINKIINFNFKWYENGLGNTGAAFIVGPSFEMRTDARFFLENKKKFISDLEANHASKEDIREIQRQNTTIGNLKVITHATKTANRGIKSRLIYTDYLGYEALAVTKPMTVLGMKWSLVVRMRTEEAFNYLEEIRKYIFWCAFITILCSVAVAFFVSFRITQPLSMLTSNAYELSKGNFNTPILVSGKDELNELANGFRNMQSQILSLITDLRSSNTQLSEKQKEIFDSIRYASKIQENILASAEYLAEHLPQHFVYFNPKDIVSGDFYWACDVVELQNGKETKQLYLAACDSTGHGIPGAFMSLLNVNYLKQAIVELGLREPGKIFDHVKQALTVVFENQENKDGMDGILLRIEKNNPVIHFSAANNKPILIRDNVLIHLECDKMAIGKGIKMEPFHTYTLETKPNDVVYLISDGFPDQFGGEKNKKYMYKRFYEFLVSIHQLSPSAQQQQLKVEFESWTKGYEQTDDVLVIGIKF